MKQYYLLHYFDAKGERKQIERGTFQAIKRAYKGQFIELEPIHTIKRLLRGINAVYMLKRKDDAIFQIDPTYITTEKIIEL